MAYTVEELMKLPSYTRRLMSIYERGKVAQEHTRFQIWGTDIDRIEFVEGYGGVYLDGYFKVHGEIGVDWCEMVEVASYCNADRDGNVYYVGHPNSGVILKPSWREMRWMAQYASNIMLHDVHWSHEELMAWTLMIGGDWFDTLTVG